MKPCKRSARASVVEVRKPEPAPGPRHFYQLSALRECDVSGCKVWPAKTDVRGIAVGERNVFNIAGFGGDHADAAVDQSRDTDPPALFHGQTVEALITGRPGDEPPAVRRRPRLGNYFPAQLKLGLTIVNNILIIIRINQLT